MAHRMDERGFLLLEVVLAGVSLIVLVLALRLYPQAVQRDAWESCRARAIFLARGQMEGLRWQSARGEIRPGPVPWLGFAEDLEAASGVAGPDGSCRFTVQTDVGERDSEDSMYPVTITVRWQGSSVKEGELRFEGRVENLEQEGKGA